MRWSFDPTRDTGAIVLPGDRAIWFSGADALRIEQRIDDAESPEDIQSILQEEYDEKDH
jgi:hypothetical protein